MKTLLPLVAAALLAACASQPATTTTAAPDSSRPAVTCVDETPVGSNIRKRRCYANDADSQRARDAQVQNLMRPSGANRGAGAQ